VIGLGHGGHCVVGGTNHGSTRNLRVHWAALQESGASGMLEWKDSNVTSATNFGEVFRREL
jgi:hypothetical protein